MALRRPLKTQIALRTKPRPAQSHRLALALDSGCACRATVWDHAAFPSAMGKGVLIQIPALSRRGERLALAFRVASRKAGKHAAGASRPIARRSALHLALATTVALTSFTGQRSGVEAVSHQLITKPRGQGPDDPPPAPIPVWWPWGRGGGTAGGGPIVLHHVGKL